METSPPPSLAMPRLRVSRRTANPVFTDDDPGAPVAGPSRSCTALRDLDDDQDEEERAESTPKLSSQVPLPPTSPPPPPLSALPADQHPAARLRALITRVARGAPSSPPPRPASPSDLDSDYDMPPPPRFPPATPSIARETLKDIFSHALRDAGSSPEKATRGRSGSFDLSEVEASPRVRERARMKSGRRSMSDNDDEPDSSKAKRRSFRSAHAATIDSLRQRLTTFNASAKNPPISSSDDNDTDASLNNDTATFLKNLSPARGSPPAATSTPHKSIQMPTMSQFQSNLMEHDSEMRDAMGAYDSYEVDSPAGRRPLSFPPPSRLPRLSQSPGSTHERSVSKAGSLDRRPVSFHGGDASLLRAPSSLGGNAHQSQESLHKPTLKGLGRPATPDPGRKLDPRSLSRTSLGNGLPRTRQDSFGSLRSFDSGRSSRASSISSQASYREQLQEMEQERNREREREWNRPHPKLTRSSSNASLRAQQQQQQQHEERARTASTPDAPRARRAFSQHSNGSSGSLGSPGEQRPASRLSAHAPRSTPGWAAPPSPALSLRRQPSFSSSGTNSPTGSLHSAGSGSSRDDEDAVQQERERNWNAPRPRWSVHAGIEERRSVSPGEGVPRVRAASLQVESEVRRLGSGLLRVPTSPAGLGGQTTAPRSASPLSRHSPSPVSRAGSYPTMTTTRPASPLPPLTSRQTPSLTRPGWAFPRNRAVLPPLELEDDTIDKMATFGGGPERGNVFSPPTVDEASPFHGEDGSGQSWRGHRRTASEVFSGVGDGPALNIEQERADDIVFVDPASDDDVSPNENSPTVRTNGPETVFAPSTSCVSDEARLSRARGPAVLQEVSPPPSPPETMVTPPRRNSSNASRLEFPTPPRPHDLPDLPELPSTSEEDVTVDGPRANGGTHLVDSLKTPKPPGAWAGTPAPARERAQSASDEVEDAHRDSGLATPMSSLSRARAGSLPMQTPAPPGAWTGTPGTADRRKSILKVRFDVESEQSMSEGVGGARADGTVDFNPFAAASSSDPEPFDIPTPVSPRSPRKSAGIRVVDAFGREQQGYGKDADEDVGSPNVSRSKGAIRIVDAMGREVDDVAHAEPVAGEHAQANEPPPMSHREALVRVGRELAELTVDWNDVDRSGEELGVHTQRANELEDVSRVARETRGKLTIALGTAKKIEDELTIRFGHLRQSMRNSMFLPSSLDSSSPWWAQMSRATICGIALLQVLLVVILYRVSIARAKDIFLTTYYDPFYPDIHLYTTKPDIFRNTLSYWARNPSWSMPLDTLARTIFNWQRRLWEVWGAEDLNTSWPPT